jgi:hypothetical protein
VSATVDGDLAHAMAFVHRLGQLDVADLEVVGRTWRRVVAEDPPAWFAAEGTVGSAVGATHRQLVQEALLEELTDVVRRRGWWRLDRVEAADGQGLTEAGVQYAATLATIALLVRDVIPAQDFELIYSPFMALVPLSGPGATSTRDTSAHDTDRVTPRDASRG